MEKVKKLNLNDYDVGDTLGTGINKTNPRFIRQSPNSKKQKDKTIRRPQNNEKIRNHKIKTDRSHNERN